MIVTVPGAAIAQDGDDPDLVAPLHNDTIGITVGYVERHGNGARNAIGLSTLTYTRLFDIRRTLIYFVSGSNDSSVNAAQQAVEQSTTSAQSSATGNAQDAVQSSIQSTV